MNPTPPSSGTALLLTSDLMLASQAEGAARRTGTTLVVVGSADEAVAAHDVHRPGCVWTDLSLSGLDIQRLVDQLRAADHRPATIAAFGPHVQQARLDRARRAGCDRVVSRGQFCREMETLLTAGGRSSEDAEARGGAPRANRTEPARDNGPLP